MARASLSAPEIAALKSLAAIAPALVAAATVPTGAPVALPALDQHIGPSGKPDGRRFACTATKPCGRLLRSAARAGIHGVAAGGHTAA